MRYPHQIAMVQYDFSGDTPRVARGFQVPALVVPFANVDATVSYSVRPDDNILRTTSNEGQWLVFISKQIYFGIADVFNLVDNARELVDIHTIEGVYNPFNAIVTGNVERPDFFIDSISIFDGYVAMGYKVGIAHF